MHASNHTFHVDFTCSNPNCEVTQTFDGKFDELLGLMRESGWWLCWECGEEMNYNVDFGIIPEGKYQIVGKNHRCVTKKLIEKYHTPEEIEAFNEWISGQTMFELPDGSAGIFISDYERWVEQNCIR